MQIGKLISGVSTRVRSKSIDRLTGKIGVNETYVGGPEEDKRVARSRKFIVVVAAEKTGRAVGRIRLKRVKEVSVEMPAGLHSRDFGAWYNNSHRRVERLWASNIASRSSAAGTNKLTRIALSPPRPAGRFRWTGTLHLHYSRKISVTRVKEIPTFRLCSY